MPGYNPNNYATVAERLAAATSAITSIVTEPPQFLTEMMGYVRATVALQDGRSATGMASFRLDLQGKSAQATNPLEDAETSAVGRALAFLGYHSNKSIASQEEVQEAQRRASYQPAPTNGHSEPATDKQRGLIKGLRNDLGWTNDDLSLYIEESGVTLETLDKRTASQIIEGMQTLKAQQSHVQP